MTPDALLALRFGPEQIGGQRPLPAGKKKEQPADRSLAATITKDASAQTYYTVRLLVDPDRVADAYRAYAYFRWVDDTLDREESEQDERLAFLARQQALLNDAYRGRSPAGLAPVEQLLIDLLRGNRGENGGLQAYLDNMMAVMAFDAGRRGRLISQAELDAYTHWLAVAVTEALHYFIGHHCRSPQGEARYLAANAAHITHMLRDTVEDVAAGYYNVPAELLTAHDIGPEDIGSEPYRQWVAQRVAVARSHFAAGKEYLAQVESRRCRIAGCAYIARFEGVLDAIEQEGYRLRPGYPECKGAPAVLRGCRLALALAAGRHPIGRALLSPEQVTHPGVTPRFS